VYKKAPLVNYQRDFIIEIASFYVVRLW